MQQRLYNRTKHLAARKNQPITKEISNHARNVDQK